MAQASDNPNATLVRRMFRAVCAGDLEAAAGLLDENIVVHYPGRSSLAGDHKGRKQVMTWSRRGTKLSEGKVNVTLNRVLADDEIAVALYVTSAKRAGKTIQERNVAVLRFAGGKVAEAWVTPADLTASDAFWS